MKKNNHNHLRHTLLALVFSVTGVGCASMNTGEFLKGCIIGGGTAAGSVSMAASTSNVKATGSALAIGGVLGCLASGVMASDTHRQAEDDYNAKQERASKALKLKIYDVDHDLCIIKGECDAAGKKFDDNNKNKSNTNSEKGGFDRGNIGK